MNRLEMLKSLEDLFIKAKTTIASNLQALPETIYEGTKNKAVFANEILSELSKTEQILLNSIDLNQGIMSKKDWENKVSRSFLPFVFVTSSEHLNPQKQAKMENIKKR